MVLTHKTENIEISKDKKTKFERFKDYIKQKAFIVAVPLVLTFTTPVQAEENYVYSGTEETEKEIEIKINSNMKNAYLDYKEGKIDMEKLEVKIFKELYTQVKEKDFPSTQLAHAVEELIGQLSGMNLEREVKQKKVFKNKKVKKPQIKVEKPKSITEEIKTIPSGEEQKAVQHFAEGISQLEQIARENENENENYDEEVITNSVPLYEAVDNFELNFDKRIKKISNAVGQLVEQYKNEKYETIRIDDYMLEAKNDKNGAIWISNLLLKEIEKLEEETSKESKLLLSKIDKCEVCTDTYPLKETISDLVSELSSRKNDFTSEINKSGINFDEKEEVKLVKEEEISEDKKLEMEYEKKLEQIRKLNQKSKLNDKVRWKFTSEIDVKKQAHNVPSSENRGIVNETINVNVGNSIIGKSGIGLDLVTGYSAELVSFMNNIHDTRDTDIVGSKYYAPDNHLARMLLGLSYNSEEISLSLMGGYKLGKLYTSNVLGRDGYYPIVAGGLKSTKDQFTKLKFEIPVLFNVGQNMNVSLEHFSKYIFINSNVDFSRQSSIWVTENDNTVKDTFNVLNNQNFVGVTLYPFQIGNDTTISPTLFAVGSYNMLNANNLQKVQSWNIGPGIGLNALYKGQPLMVLGYGYGMGKYDAKYTDFEGVNSYKLKSFYSTHNVLIRLHAPITENLNINSEFTFVKGDAQGIEGIKSPMNDYSRFLLLLTYVY
jgi:hypothetical protein